MINELLSRPNIQEFLNKYSSSRWKELISDLFEIGVLNLRNSYYRYEFSHKELHGIISNLEHPAPAPTPIPSTPFNQSSYQNYPPQKINNQYQDSNFSYPKNPSNYNSKNTFNKKYLNENLSNYYYNYDYGRRMRRLAKLENRATTSKMDAFYSEKNELPLKESLKKKGKRSHREIQDKIFESQQKRQYQRYLIRDLKQQYIKDRNKELKRKKIEKMMAKQAEEDIKEEEREKRRLKDEEDFQEGYKEDYQEEDEIEEDEQTDKYNDYNRGYDDDEEEEEEGEGEEGEQIDNGGEEQGGEEEQIDDGEEEQGGEEGQYQQAQT